MQITICGGGNAAHVLAGLLGSREELSVHVYAPYGDEAEHWREGVRKNGGITVSTPEGKIIGRPNAIYSDPEAAVALSLIHI